MFEESYMWHNPGGACKHFLARFLRVRLHIYVFVYVCMYLCMCVCMHVHCPVDTCFNFKYIHECESNEMHYLSCVNLSVIRDSEWVEPMEFWENADTKRRLHNLVTVSGMLTHLTQLRARHATEEEITLFHTKEYFQSVKDQAEKGICTSYSA